MTFRPTRVVRTNTTNARRGVVRASVAISAFGALSLTAAPAGAHVGGPTNGFADGWLHPILGPDHLLAMVAVGVIAAVVAPSARSPLAALGRWVVPLVFLSGMAVGAAFGLAGWSFPLVEVTIVVSVIALGVAVAGAIGSASTWAPLLLLAGLAHGNAHGAEAPSAANPFLYVAGFLTATLLLHAAGLLGGTVVRRHPRLRLILGATLASAGALLGT